MFVPLQSLFTGGFDLVLWVPRWCVLRSGFRSRFRLKSREWSLVSDGVSVSLYFLSQCTQSRVRSSCVTDSGRFSLSLSSYRRSVACSWMVWRVSFSDKAWKVQCTAAIRKDLLWVLKTKGEVWVGITCFVNVPIRHRMLRKGKWKGIRQIWSFERNTKPLDFSFLPYLLVFLGWYYRLSCF